ncbi:hypothetical protein MJO28_002474 [Puccinia striiformis f. sp. tritici]|uniref:Decapping nuclease n=2 Tax=Puccinia striiformis f. sp. tritici TaxID=168172 RepID=A0A0L0VMA6_9BASI|nr:hypothetical protein Pst134EB_006631 [Puccinia striiformis f. sp. tritici]KAI7958683.1 hypothetical protein MJO28_002474 [Puccinia striiformis f. sp. tritici]KNF00140.1 hypothetical protein PSTG_06550 [Puccinia striiformis f. sp. tritici PST-78]
MPVDLSNLLNSTPVSPPHSHYPNQEGPSAIELANLLSPAVDTHRALPKQQQQQQNDEDAEFKKIPLTAASIHTLSQSSITKQVYQRPIPFTSFSYDPDRKIRTGVHQFESLRPLHVPKDLVGFNLTHRIDQAIYRDESIDEGLDGLLISLIDYVDNVNPQERLDHCRGILGSNLITWRGILTKLCASVYESSRPGSEENGWTKEVMMVDGIIYIVEAPPPDSSQEGNSSTTQTYYGHSYESLVTNPKGFEDVNTNVQWCSVVKVNLNGNRIIIGGEVDCILPHTFDQIQTYLRNNVDDLDNRNMEPVQSDEFIEVKTSILPVTDKEHYTLYRYKLLKFWLQSYLLGVSKIHVGLRDRNGIVRGVSEYNTLEIPSIVKSKMNKQNHNARWSTEKCLSSGTSIIEFVRDKLNQHRKDDDEKCRLSYFHNRFQSIVDDEVLRRRSLQDDNEEKKIGISEECHQDIRDYLQGWPVYNLVFKPPQSAGKNGTLELIEIDSDRPSRTCTNDSLFGFDHSLLTINNSDGNRTRIGFLPSIWIQYLVGIKVQLAVEEEKLKS